MIYVQQKPQMFQIFVDLETTGLNAKKDDIVEFAGIKVIKGEIVESYQQYINPSSFIHPKAFASHGLSNAFLSQYPKWSEIQEKIRDFMGNGHFFAYNASFDSRFLAAKGINMNRPVMDLLKRARAVLGNKVSNHKLPTVCHYYGIETEFHSALNDTNVLLQLAKIWGVV